jgi:hypothetical protein
VRINSDKYTALAGRLGSMVGLMNKSGMCFRNWVVPANPNSGGQQGVRNTLRTLSQAWSGILTQGQRDAWNAYAATLVFVSKLGTTYTISGFNAYCAANGARMVAGLSRIDAGPTLPGFDTYTPVVPTFQVSAHSLSVAYTNTDEWANEVGGALVVRISPTEFFAGVTFWEGPFIYAGKAVGAGTPPTSPLVVQYSAGRFTTGNQSAIAVRSVRADGRFSKEVIFRGLGV